MDEDNPGVGIEKSLRAKHQRRLQSIIRDLDSIARLLEQASTDSVRDEIKIVRDRLDSIEEQLEAPAKTFSE